MSRAFSGNSFTERSFTTAPSCVLVVSTSGASEVTSTTSCASPTCMVILSVTTWFTSTVTSRADVLLESGEVELEAIGADRHLDESCNLRCRW